ncbi:MAG: hypothetical protein ACQESN_00605 [Thermotogota bacterium]
MLIKKFKLFLERNKFNKYKKKIINYDIKLPKKIIKNSLYLIKWKDLDFIIESMLQNIGNGIFYYIIFFNNKKINDFKLDIIKQITDFLGVHLILIGKENYYIYQNIKYKFHINSNKNKNIDKRLIFLTNEDLMDLSIIGFINLIEDPILFTNSHDEILIQNFVNVSLSVCINDQGKIFKPIVFDDVIKLNKNILTINFSEIEILKKKVHQNDRFGKKILNLINK